MDGTTRKPAPIADKLWLGLAISFLAGLQAQGQFSVTWTNLHPSSSLYSYANCASQSQQFGQIYVSNKYHAALWSGTVDTLVDLHPPGADFSWVTAANDGQQVGYVVIGARGHAGLWSGTAASFAALTPPWADSSEALGVGNSQQVGSCSLTNPSSGVHAALWSGNSNSCVDLQPPFWKIRRHPTTRGGNQVGAVTEYVTGNEFTALWSGTPACVRGVRSRVVG